MADSSVGRVPSRQDRPQVGVDRGKNLSDVGGVERRSGVEAQRVTVSSEHSVHDQRMEVAVHVERAPESLRDGHGAAAPVPHAGVPRAAAEVPAPALRTRDHAARAD